MPLTTPSRTHTLQLSSNDSAPLSLVEGDWARSFARFWDDFAEWFTNVLRGIDEETLAHPYYISFALVLVWAWPHILMLPVWFGKDAYHRMDSHARGALQQARTVVPGDRPNRRSAFISKYRTVFNASYAPPTYSETTRTPLFGGTPLTAGNFALEEEHRLPVAFRIIRWTALGLAAFLIGRELYFQISA